jgi:hypothetical protein
MLQQTVRESSCRRPDVKTNLSIHVNMPVLQGTLEFQAAAAHVFQILTEQANRAVLFNLRSRLINLLLVHENFTGENERLRTLARSHESTFYKNPVESGFHAILIPKSGTKV